ncbi:cation channel sperm-associated protein 2-like, partial [Centroberyx affinis]|uniref:cation channel sperm-associated protein 2-like n=1 Tax=Centroberyx affinis TaxID=166261 RepID=UPI003A5C5CD6
DAQQKRVRSRAELVRLELIKTFKLDLLQDEQGRMTTADVFELPYYMDPEKENYTLICNILNWCVLTSFIGEFLLRWVDDFCRFWKSTWNIFDFIVTMVSLLPELIMAFRPDTARLQVMQLLRQFRMLRCLKIIPRCTQARLIMLPLTRSFKAIGNILALMMIFATIYAVVGVELFRNFSRSEMEDLAFNNSFKDITSALISLFILFTMDNWNALLDNIRKVKELNQFICRLYIILWLIFATCIIRSMIVGVLEWETYVKEAIIAMQEPKNAEKVEWPKDKLFRYFQLLEKLERIREEWMRLQNNLIQVLRRRHT